ncbi:MAG: hypothetical protein E6H07_13675 [Bacteroidetes bacterium]|nr:MAG: hypothetical protein E6H07_13675 [Bacteroidota bacterium]
MEEITNWDVIVIKQLIPSNNLGITQIRNFTTIKNLYFEKESYANILNLIKANDLKAVRGIEQLPKKGFGEYLHIVTFTDQDHQNYAITVYDSDELYQNPEIIDIILLA